nr:hypothetical protein Iba_chr13cCG1720 [Ipomoea batatas]
MALLALGMVGKEVRQRVDDALPREETLVGKTGFERILVDYWAPAALFFVFHLEMRYDMFNEYHKLLDNTNPSEFVSLPAVPSMLNFPSPSEAISLLENTIPDAFMIEASGWLAIASVAPISSHCPVSFNRMSEFILTSNVRLQSNQQRIPTVPCDQYQNQQLQHVQRPSLVPFVARIFVSQGLSEVVL